MVNKKDLMLFMTPTNNPDDFFEFLLPSIENILDIKEYCIFSFIFQPPFTSDQINEIHKRLDDYNINYSIQYKEYGIPKVGYIPLMKMLNDCSVVNKNSLFYATLDDDMAFLNGTKIKTIGFQYLNLLCRMLLDKNIGLATLGNSNSFYYSDKIFPLDIKCKQKFWTGRGMIYRNYNSQFVPDHIANLYGGNTDILPAVYNLIEYNSYAISCSNGLCSHCENRKIDGGVEFKWYEVNNINDTTLTGNYYKSHYNKNIFSGTEQSLVSPQIFSNYLKNTGYDFEDESISFKYTSQFNFNINDLKNSINMILSEL